MNRPQYLDILDKVRAGTHRIISYRGSNSATRYRVQKLHSERGWLDEVHAENAVRVAAKKLAGQFYPTYGITIWT